jgi:hypothetical protein
MALAVRRTGCMAMAVTGTAVTVMAAGSLLSDAFS